MPEMKQKARAKQRDVRHRGRLTQIPIYLGKLLRSLIYQNDWKVFPMSAVIAALLSMVIRRDFALTMEGTLKGAFALTCVAIWNGCFNSIQSICRERTIIKREHRSGMHISSYIIAHMIYQALLCLLQSIITLLVCNFMGVHFPQDKALFTGSIMADLTITLFLIAYASDMISLLVSAIAHTTTGAMTVMPFLLIFQLVFSGGLFSLPAWAQPISNFTISNYGLKCIAAQVDYNHQPMVTGWNTLIKLRDKEVSQDMTLDDIFSRLEDKDNPAVARIRAAKLNEFLTVPAATPTDLTATPTNLAATADSATPTNLAATADGASATDLYGLTEEEAAQLAALQAEAFENLTIGELYDTLSAIPELQPYRIMPFHVQFRVSDVIDLIGEEKLKDLIQNQTAAVSYVEAYDHDRGKILGYWLVVSLFALAFAAASTIVLEFIDKDKH